MTQRACLMAVAKIATMLADTEFDVRGRVQVRIYTGHNEEYSQVLVGMGDGYDTHSLTAYSVGTEAECVDWLERQVNGSGAELLHEVRAYWTEGDKRNAICKEYDEVLYATAAVSDEELPDQFKDITDFMYEVVSGCGRYSDSTLYELAEQRLSELRAFKDWYQTVWRPANVTE